MSFEPVMLSKIINVQCLNLLNMCVIALAKMQACFIVYNRHFRKYRSGTVNSNTVNSKFHLIRSLFEIFARFLSFHV